MSGLEVIVGIAVVALVAFGIWWSAKRRKDLTAWAARKGLALRPGRDYGFDERYPAFGCLRRGHSRCAFGIEDVVEGENRREGNG